jgi:hypothetical protein
VHGGGGEGGALVGGADGVGVAGAPASRDSAGAAFGSLLQPPHVADNAAHASAVSAALRAALTIVSSE